MKPIMKKLLMSAFAAVILLPGVSTITATAQDRHYPRPQRVIIYRPFYPIYDPFWDPFWDPYWWPNYRVVDPIAYNQEWGYREGRDEGKDDAKVGRPPNPTNNKDYYKSSSYAYRQAFIQGYYDAYREKRPY